MDKDLVELAKSVFRALPSAWRPAVVMGIVAAAMVYGYYAKIANPINEAHAAGEANTAAIKELDQKGEERNRQVQKRLGAIENNQSRQDQKLDDMSDQMHTMLQIMLTGQRPPPRQRK